MALDAALSIDNYVGSTPFTVQFTGIEVSGTPISWLWNFGDGTTSTEQSPSHTYTSIGTYSVGLIVSDGVDDVSLTYEKVISVLKLDFDAYPKSGKSPLTVRFTDNSRTPSVYTITGREWDFGDETAFSTTTSPVHSYVNTGTFSVSLTATVRRV